MIHGYQKHGGQGQEDTRKYKEQENIKQQTVELYNN